MKYNFLILISIIFTILFSSSASATFSDNFDSGSIATWTVTNGSWSIHNPPICDYCLYSSGSPATISNSIGTGNRYITFDVYRNVNANTATTLYWSGTSRGMKYNALTGSLTSLGFTITPITLTVSTWYRIRLTIVNSDTQIIVNVTNSNTGVSFAEQQVAYSYVESDNVRINDTINNVVYLDNLTFQGASPTTTTSISWGAQSYTVGDSPSFSWQISDTDWNSFNRFFVRFYKNDVLQDFGTFSIGCLCSSQLDVAQSGTYTISADEPGEYKVTLEEGILSYSILSDSTVRVNAQTASYFLIPGTALIKTNIPVTYHIGIGGIQSGLEWFFINNGVEERERGINLGTTTDGTVNVTFSKVGTYNVYLKSLTGTSQIFQTHTVTTSFISGGTPTNNFSASDITLIPVNGTGGPGANYSMNDVLYGNYSIKGSVFSGEGVFFIDIYNNDSQTETATFFEDFGGSVGLSDSGLYAYLISIAPSATGSTNKFIPGNNLIRLMVQNPNLTYTVLATEPFNLSRINAAGYGLDVSPLKTTINTPVTAIVTVPNSLSRLEVTGTTGYNKTYKLPPGTTTITTAFKDKGIYGYNLIDPSDQVQMTTQVEVGIVPVPTASPTPPISPMTSVNSMSDNILLFISMPAFWGLIIWVLLVYGVAASHKPGTNDPTALVAFILANIEAAIGFWSPFTFYVLAITWLIAAIMFISSGAGKQTTTGEK